MKSSLSKYHDTKAFYKTLIFLIVVLPLCFGVESSDVVIHKVSWLLTSILSLVSVLYIINHFKGQ